MDHQQTRMMTFSILLIDDQISNNIFIVEAISQRLADYRLSIVRSIEEATIEAEGIQLILLSLDQLGPEDLDHHLSILSQAHPQVPFIIIAPQMLSQVDETKLFAALKTGADDYITLSEIGLFRLDQQLKKFQGQPPRPALTGTDQQLLTALGKGASELAIQGIGLDDRVHTWNEAAEKLFGLTQKQAIGLHITELPLSPPSVLRLKDILDQARSQGHPFSVPHYPLEGHNSQRRWARVYVYPVPYHTPDDPRPVETVYIVSADVTDFKEIELDSRRYNQELQVLLEISRQVSKQLNLEITLGTIIEQAKYLLNADNCQVYFLDEEDQISPPIISIGPNPHYNWSLSQKIINIVLDTNRGLMINAGSSEAAISQDLPASKEHLLCAPLMTTDQLIGVMVARRRRGALFTQGDLHFFENLVQHASSAINNARLFEETQQGLEELSVLYEASTVVSTNWNTQEVLDKLIQQIVQAINVSQGYIVSWARHQQQGFIKAMFTNNEAHPPVTPRTPTFSFTERPALLTAIQQQRVVLFEANNPSLNRAEQLDMKNHGCLFRLIIPLIVKGKTIGWAELWETRPGRHFTIDEIRLARMLSIQTAVALENAQYLQQMQQTLEETTALYHVSSALATTQDSQNIMHIVLQEYLRVLELNQGRVIIFDFKAKWGIIKINIQEKSSVNEVPTDPAPATEGQQIPLENNPLYERLMGTRQPVIVEDTQADWLKRSRSGVEAPTPVIGSWVGEQTVSMLVIPIQVREEIIGVIVAEATGQTRIFDAWAISLGQAMADQLGIALQNVELYELESKRRHQAETLREVSFIVGSSLNLEEVLGHILDQLRRVITYDSAAIHLVEGNRRRIIAGHGFPNLETVIGQTYPVKLDKNEPGSIAIHNRRPFVIGDIAKVNDLFIGLPHERIKSWMGIPLIARDKVIGLITIDRMMINAFNDEDMALTQAFANQVAIALENARLYEIEVREIERELEIAHEIQETLLPQFAPQFPDLQISGRITPAHQIGGDFFHFFSVDSDQFGVAIGDVSGKGIPAALYMAAAMTAIDAEISNKNPGPGQLLEDLHQVLFERLQQNRMNIGLQVATFSPLPSLPDRSFPQNLGGKIMTIASAGMIAPIVATEGDVQFLETEGLPLGTPLGDPSYQELEILLIPGNAIIFTSDGIVEAQNEAGELFGFDRLEATIQEIAPTKDAELIAEHLIYKVQNFMGEAEDQHDDMTVVVVVVEA